MSQANDPRPDTDRNYDPNRDRLFRGGVVRTLDANVPDGDSVALRSGRIVSVGPEVQVRQRLAPGYETIDLEGATVVPAFHDAHVHLASHGLEGMQVGLSDAESWAEAVERVLASAQRGETTGPEDWILGQGFAEQRWSDGPPDRGLLDGALGERPVLLRSQDHHSAIANGEALRRAGIHAGTVDPADGRIERREDGSPTGLLRERAVDLLLDTVPELPTQRLHAAILEGADRLAALGVTTVHHMSYEPAGHLKAIADLASAGTLPLRVWACLPQEELEAACALGLASGHGGDRFMLGGAKFFVDGALGSLTSWMLEPYQDTEQAGMRVIDPEVLHRRIGTAIQAGLTPVAHAIGDAAVRTLLDVLEAHRLAWSGAGLRPRVEHAQHVHPDDVRRIGEMGLIASMQPLHLSFDAPTIRRRLADREERAYPMRDLLDAGAQLAFGSDTPVATPDPIRAMRTAVERSGLQGITVAPGQALTPLEAVRAHTAGAAYAIGREDRSGALRPGAHADLTVLSHDPTRSLPSDLKVLATVVEGRFSYRA